MKSYITKSNYLEGKRCPRLLAYKIMGHALNPHRGSPLKDFLAKQGKDVGLQAQELFKGQFCVTVSEKCIPLAVIETQKALLKAEILFEGAFESDGLVTRPDILDLGQNELIEVKSTTEIKEEHILDVAFQKLVLSKAVPKIKRFNLAHINKQYVFEPTLNLNDLFTFTDVTEVVAGKISKLEKELEDIRRLIENNILPQREIGQHCIGETECPYKSVCWGDDEKDTIFDLRRDISGKKFLLHKEGIRSLKNIPESVTLTKHQALQREAEIQNCPIINQFAITEALHEVTYPLFFLDFESFSEAIPRYPQTTAYQQIPFQASLHVLGNLKQKPKHHSFLHTEDSDPRKSLTSFLLDVLGEKGSIVTYHASFEIGRLFELIKVVPDKEAEILALIERVWDLEMIFDKGLYVHKDFRGSTSIKKVLPVFCPEISYDNFEINNGALASVQYLKMISPNTTEDEKLKIKTNLELYCKQDSYAMYVIFKKLFKEVL